MALLDYFAHDPPVRRISVHSFCAALHEWIRGNVTRQNVIDTFALTAQDEAQLDAVKAVYDAEPTNFAKMDYLVSVQSALILYEDNLATEALVKTFLGLT